MAHISLNTDEPGIRGLLAFRPETGGPLSALADALLHGPSPLSPGERELIAAFVSDRNDCRYCCLSHSAHAAVQLPGGQALVEQVRADPGAAPVPARLKALLAVADLVRQGGDQVSADAIDAARATGATDVEIHDTVLIAAAFCMYNRYVDGLATFAPDSPAAYFEHAGQIAEHGYLAARP